MEKFKELSFPVPWGHIAAKAWGDPCNKPVLVIHGRQDNAGSFDRLIPKLPSLFYYVCVDLPGHGYSTRMPKGFPLDIMVYVSAVRRVILQLKWDEFYFLGHSLGGQMGTLYAGMYPESVIKLIGLDPYPLVTLYKENYATYCRKIFEDTVELEEKLKNKPPPSYTYEEALNKLIANRPTPITLETAEHLLPRTLRENKHGYYYSTDQRMKFHLTTPIDHELYYSVLTKVKCPFLFISSNQSVEFMKATAEWDTHYQNHLGSLKQNPAFKYVVVDGPHDVHSNEPEKVSDMISKFLIHKKSSL